MSDLFRETPLGQIIRYVTGNKVLLYPEERPEFQCPASYKHPDGPVSSGNPVTPASEADNQLQTPASQESQDLEKAITRDVALERAVTRVDLEKLTTRADLERAYTAATVRNGPSVPVIPEKLEDGTILVDWYETGDPANPQNWSTGRKAFVTFQIWCVLPLFRLGAGLC